MQPFYRYPTALRVKSPATQFKAVLETMKITYPDSLGEKRRQKPDPGCHRPFPEPLWWVGRDKLIDDLTCIDIIRHASPLRISLTVAEV